MSECGSFSFDVNFEADGSAIADLLFPEKLDTREFVFVFPDGEFCRFLARPEETPDLGVDLCDVEVLERGSLYDKQGSD